MATAIRFFLSIIMIALLCLSGEEACRSGHEQEFEIAAVQLLITPASDHRQSSDAGGANSTDTDHCIQLKMRVALPYLASNSAFEPVNYVDTPAVNRGDMFTSIYRPPIISA